MHKIFEYWLGGKAELVWQCLWVCCLHFISHTVCFSLQLATSNDFLHSPKLQRMPGSEDLFCNRSRAPRTLLELSSEHCALGAGEWGTRSAGAAKAQHIAVSQQPGGSEKPGQDQTWGICVLLALGSVLVPSGESWPCQVCCLAVVWVLRNTLKEGIVPGGSFAPLQSPAGAVPWKSSQSFSLSPLSL